MFDMNFFKKKKKKKKFTFITFSGKYSEIRDIDISIKDSKDLNVLKLY